MCDAVVPRLHKRFDARELIDGELFERGFSAQLGRLEVLWIPKPDLAQLAFLGQDRTPVALEDRVSRAALARFALDEIVEGPGALAHRVLRSPTACSENQRQATSDVTSSTGM